MYTGTFKFYKGIVCCVDCQGEVVYQAGNINRPVYLRSGLKYIQVYVQRVYNVSRSCCKGDAIAWYII